MFHVFRFLNFENRIESLFNLFYRDEKKKFKKLHREVEKMAALMKDDDDEDGDDGEKEDEDVEDKEDSEAEESESEESESGESDSETEESEPEVMNLYI